MPPRLTKPTNVPASRQPLVDLLWRFYVAARRPTTRRIAEVIEAWDDDRRTGTANHETVRRTLRGEQIGAWQTVEVIFLALCQLADVDPNDADDPDENDRWSPPPGTHIELLHQYWNQAVDDSPMPDVPKTRKERAEQAALEQARPAALWDSAPSGASSYPDEAPF
ncbi:hypothetical protein [Actinoalloteichus caeruleus]|uniref:hypothetical protein n=1 Tax=Actinoalloteichus cyanogriseus TaxID=2893586 RepID=UPI003AB002AF